MKIKSYFASTVAAAIDQARREMGPEAVIVETRRAGEESRHLGEYEVVVGLVAEEPGAAGEPAAAAAQAVSPAIPPEVRERLSGELAEMREQLEMMRKAISRNVLTAPRWSLASSGLAEVFSMLVAEEVEPELAREVLDAVDASLAGARGEGSMASALVAELGGRLEVNPAIGRDTAGRRVAALVGPPGTGKTTTLVKLAITHGLTGRRPVQLLSIDNYRVGGTEQLRSYAAILGVGFQAVDTVGALAQALEEYRAKELILIDTPGYGTREMDNAADLARFLAGRPDIDVHLALTASMKSADLARVARQFEIMRPSSFLFTRLDETDSLGSLYSLAVRCAKPVSFLSTGQQIPEDLEPASRERIVGGLVARMRRVTLAA
jgi:flagellar biosynthesis protein FlhF